MPNASQPARNDPHGESRRVLTLFDCICIIVGTIIGAGIFEMPFLVSSNVQNAYWLSAVWILGGAIALAGALCFAELTTCYPDRGGDYGYLKRGFHRRIGFAFSWAAFWIIRPGNIGAMAMIFGKFASQVLPFNLSPFSYATSSVVALTLINLAGLRLGKWTINVLTVAKVIGIVMIIFAAFIIWSPDAEMPKPQESSITTSESSNSNPVANPNSVDSGAIVDTPPIDNDSASPENEPTFWNHWNSFWMAMVFAMFAYGGWNDIAFVSTEVKNPDRNLLWSLVLGTLGVVTIYLFVNFALVYGLGFNQISLSTNPTMTLVETNMGETGRKLFAALVSLSCLGAINAMIFTSPRIYTATAKDYPELAWLAESGKRQRIWVGLVLQMVVTISFVFAFSYSNADGIKNIVNATAPYFWFFLALTVVSLIICRFKYDTSVFKGYRGPFFPLLPVVFTLACIFMIYSCVNYSISQEQLWLPTICISIWMAVGFGLSFFIGNSPVEEGEDR